MIDPRAALLAATLLVLMSFDPKKAGGAEDQGPPNILIILADDLGYGDLSGFGARDMETPNIDGLVASGMRLDNFYANCPVCSPTRASLLTGRYPDLVGVPGVIRTHPENSWGYLDPSATLLPELLGRAGYHTAIVGKWHLGLEPPDTPTRRGFDHFHGFLGDMMDDYYDHRRHGFNYMRLGERGIDPRGHATDLFTDWAVAYLEERAREDRPFFLYLAYNAPHTPIQPPEDWLRRVRRREPEIEERRARLVALIEHMDDGVGRVLRALEDGGRRDRTLVIFSSDNGGQLNVGANNGPLRGGKQQMYEGGLRVPTAASWPGRIAPGTRSGRVALTMDLFPTVCEAAGVEIRHRIDGRSILPTLLGDEVAEREPPRVLFWVRREGGRRYNGQDYRAARLGPIKALRNDPFQPFEFYNLRLDPSESREGVGVTPGQRSALLDALREQVRRSGAVPWQAPFPPHRGAGAAP